MAEQVLQERPATHKPDYTRLTRSDVGVLLKLRADGLTQAEIAQRLGCNQTTVHNWLTDLTDTTDTAKSFLRGQALRMAQNIVKKGRAADHVAALKGLSVLAEESAGGLVVQIGGGSKVQINVSAGPSPVPRSELAGESTG
jgi:hypothetical protein